MRSGPALVESLQDGLKVTRANGTDYGLVTTPILHYIVRSLNTLQLAQRLRPQLKRGILQKLGDAYQRVLSGYNKSYSITIDAANGVGGPKVKELAKHLGGLVEHYRC